MNPMTFPLWMELITGRGRFDKSVSIWVGHKGQTAMCLYISLHININKYIRKRLGQVYVTLSRHWV